MRDKLASQYKVLENIPDLLSLNEEINLDIKIPKSANIWFVGVGKASIKIGKAVSKLFGQRIEDALLIAPEAVEIDTNFQVFKGSHPLPDKDTVAASYEVVDFIHRIPAGDTLIFSISGGASSMFCIPPFCIEISEIQVLYDLLLNSGASIHEMNTVRKHVCDVKGGKLISNLHHLDVISIIDSDVPGDDPSIIGSGPTIHDESTFLEVINMLNKYEIWSLIPLSIQEHLICGLEGYIPENPKPNVNEHSNHQIQLLNGYTALNSKIEHLLQNQGYNVWTNEHAYTGNVVQVAKQISAKSISILSGNDSLKKPAALIFNGECSVKVKDGGKGGRNQELALMVALSIEGQHSISMLSMDTDGIDGPTEMAGAIINSFTALDARKKKIDPERLLTQSNSYGFHKEIGTHLKTGPTGINLMDLQVVLID